MFPMEGWKLALELGNLSRWCKKNYVKYFSVQLFEFCNFNLFAIFGHNLYTDPGSGFN